MKKSFAFTIIKNIYASGFKLSLFIILLVLLSVIASAQKKNSFIMKLAPTSAIYPPALNDFEIKYNYFSNYVNKGEMVDKPISIDEVFVPQVAFGAGMIREKLIYDFTIGIGGMIDIGGIFSETQLHGFMIFGEFALRYSCSTSFTVGAEVGPVIGLMGIASRASGYGIDQGRLYGFNIGPAITLGREVSFLCSVNYLFARALANVTVNYPGDYKNLEHSDYFDLSGLYIRLGLIIRPNKSR